MYSRIFKQFCRERNIKESTIKSYAAAIKSYCSYHNISIEELISEARFDEQEKLPLKDRRLKKRLLMYRNYLFSKNRSSNTVKSYFTKIKTFYSHFEIEIPSLPDAQYPKTYETNYYDLPRHEHIKRVVDTVSVDLRAVILFMASSGTAKAETLSLTVNQFIDGCRDYFNPSFTDLQGILVELSKHDNIVPTIYLRRIKTDKYYYTFCTPEASTEIVKYLLSRDDLKLSDKLFDFTHSTLLLRFQEINDKYNWGFRGQYRFFRAHALRKFHASNIGLAAEYIDALQGRSKNQVHNAYIKINPDKLKDIYMKVMSNVTINGNVKSTTVNQEFTIVVNVFLSGKEYNIY